MHLHPSAATLLTALSLWMAGPGRPSLYAGEYAIQGDLSVSGIIQGSGSGLTDLEQSPSAVHFAPAGSNLVYASRHPAADLPQLLAVQTSTVPRTVILDRIVSVGANAVVPTEVMLFPIGGGGLDIATGITVTVQSPFQAALQTVFHGDGKVLFTPGSVPAVYPEWWGAKGDGTTNDRKALDNALASFHKILLGARTYIIGGAATPSGSLLALRSHQELRGAGIDKTILRVQNGHPGVNYKLTIIGRNDWSSYTNIVIGDMTLDGNFNNMSGAAHVGGIGLVGAGHLVERVKVIGFGSYAAPGQYRECFPINISSKSSLDKIPNIVDSCEVTAPGSVIADGLTCILNVASDMGPGVPGLPGKTMGVIRNCLVYDIPMRAVCFTGNLVEGNHARNVTMGTGWYMDTWTERNVIIRDNVFEGMWYGVRVAIGENFGGIEHLEIYDNKIALEYTASDERGVYFYINHVPSNGLAIGEAVVRDNFISGINTNSTGIRIQCLVDPGLIFGSLRLHDNIIDMPNSALPMKLSAYVHQFSNLLNRIVRMHDNTDPAGNLVPVSMERYNLNASTMTDTERNQLLPADLKRVLGL